MAKPIVYTALLVGAGVAAALTWEYVNDERREFRQAIQILNEEAERLKIGVENTKLEFEASTADYGALVARLHLERTARAAEREKLQQVYEESRRELAKLREALEAPILPMPELTDLELASRTSIALTVFTPAASPPVIRPVEDGFFADREAIEAALTATERVRASVDVLDATERQVEVLNQLLLSEREDTLSWKTQTAACVDMTEKCREAWKASERLRENDELRLEAQILEIKRLERKVWSLRLQRYGAAAVAGGLGYAAGKVF